MTLNDLLDSRAAQTPDAPSFEQEIGGRRDRADWKEFKRRVDALALALDGLGLGAGEHVAVMGQTTGEWAVTDLAILGAGGVSVGVYSTLTVDQVAYLLSDCGARIAFAGSPEELAILRAAADRIGRALTLVGWGEAEGAPGVLGFGELLATGAALLVEGGARLRELRARRGPDDAALLIYTSGTTGVPKGAMLSHGNVLALLERLRPLLPHDVGGEDVTVAFLPMAHVAEHVVGFYGRIHLGYAARYVGSVESRAVLAAVEATRPTVFGSVPRLFEKAHAKVRARVAAGSPARRALFAWAERVGRRMSRHRLAGSAPPPSLRLAHAVADRLVLSKIRNAFGGRVKYFVSGAAPIDPSVLEFFHACGLLVVEVYGMTECTAIATINRPERPRFGTVGQPIPGIELRLAPDGEVLVRGPTVFKGYLNKPAETAEALDPDGWLHTGDIGELDAEGYLRITDRKKNLLVTAGGKKIAPAPIEALLTGDPLLGPSLVVGEGRPYLGALLTLDLEEARAATGLREAAAAELAEHGEVRRRAAAAVAKANAQLARFERIRRYRILGHELAVGGAEVTPTMKLRRKAVTDRFRAEIESLYAERPGRGVLEAEGHAA